MRRVPKIVRFAAHCMLGLYIGATVGFIAVSLAHALEHVISASNASQTADSSANGLPFQEAGCKPAAGIVSKADEACPGCSKEQKRSAAMMEYYQVCNFHNRPDVVVMFVGQGATQHGIHSEGSDQTTLQPLTPPPKHLSI